MSVPLKKTRTLKDIAKTVDQYSTAVPCGSAIFAVEKYIHNHLMQSHSESIEKHKQKLTALDAKQDKTVEDIQEIKEIKDKLHSKLNLPSIRVSSCEYLEIGAARTFWPISKVGEATHSNQYLRVALSAKALDRFLTPIENLASKCDYSKTEQGIGNHSKCGARSCPLKQRLRLILGHELSHILDFYFEYVDTELSETEKEKKHFEFANEILRLRDEYLFS